MSTFSRARHSRWLERNSHAYQNISDEPVAGDHELQDFNMLSSPGPEPDAVSLQAYHTPLVKLSDSKAAVVSDGAPCRTCEEEDPKTKYFQGWRMGVTLCAATAGSVLTINVVLTVVAWSKFGLSSGIGTLQEGSCRTTKEISLWLHVAINVLSTLLLGASNYCMQCLASPTRKEVDKAHAQQVWLDIGVPSVRNLSRISRRRALLWFCLAISSLPLHLFYNSAIFSTLESQKYVVLGASPESISNILQNWSTPGQNASGSELPSYDLLRFRNASDWERLENEACIETYAQELMSAHGDLLAVSSDINGSQFIPTFRNFDGLQNDWISDAYPTHKGDTKYVVQHAASWVISDDQQDNARLYHVQYCLSEPIEERCRVQFSIIIMVFVLLCNLIKTLCILLTLRIQECPPLVTLGDALESFLRKADPATEAMCLAEKGAFARKKWEAAPTKWRKMRHRWFSSASKKRWLICNVLCLCYLASLSYLLGLGQYLALERYRLPFHSLLQLPFGAVTSKSLIGGSSPGTKSGVLLTVIIANSPQVLLSFLFLTYNSLFTCMLLADELNDYARKRKPVRVTSPTGNQRSTYRLQLPYRYGIPLLVISGTLHWLVSQSLFLARVVSYDDDGQEVTLRSYSTVGYSCIAILTVIVFGTIVVLLGILTGFRRYKPGIPLVGSCSAAISAACHRPKEDHNAADKPVMWGVVSSENGIGHCCFTSFEVTPPVEGKLYGNLDGHGWE